MTMLRRYDKYLLMNQISGEENFRWCLRDGCENGQLYENGLLHDDDDPFGLDGVEAPFEPRIICRECDFAMCFTHQTPWHTGLTCAQVDSQREHGDAHHTESRGWIDQNTKKCPRCRIDIEKGNACFHMTCKSTARHPERLSHYLYTNFFFQRGSLPSCAGNCGHEFCWECLADWGGGGYHMDRARHNPGCFFITSNHGPSGLAGRNIDEALGRGGPAHARWA